MADVADLTVKADTKQVAAGAKDLDKLNKSSKNVNKSTKDTAKGFKKTGKAAKGARAEFAKMAGALVTVTAAFAGIKNVISIGASFESAISELAAITGATGKDLEFLSDAAKEFGASTTLSATQVAEAFKLVASAKPDLLESGEALKEVTKQAILLAEAAGIDVPTSARVLGSALNQFQADASEASRFINVLAAGAKFGSSEIADTASAIEKSGVVARLAGLSFEELNTAIQLLAANGIKAELAGTGLKTVFLRLMTQTRTEFNPTVVGFAKAFENLQKAQLDTTEIQKIFGQEAFTIGKILIDNAGKMEAFTNKLTGTSTAAEQAAARFDNLNGDMLRLSSVSSDSAIALFEGLNPALRATVQLVTEIIPRLKLLGSILKTGVLLPAIETAKAFAFLAFQYNAFKDAITGGGQRGAINKIFEEDMKALREMTNLVLKDLDKATDEFIKRGAKDDLVANEAKLQALKEMNAKLLKEVQDGEKAKGEVRGEALKRFANEAEKTFVLLDNVGVRSVQKLEDTIVTAFQTGKFAAQDFADFVIAELIRIQVRQSITGPLSGFLGGLFGGGASASSASIAAGAGGGLAGSLPAFAHGGSFNVGGSGGTDSQVVAFRASPNERVTVETPSQQAGGGDINITVMVDASNSATVEEVARMGAQAGTEEALRQIDSDFSRGGPLRRRLAV